MFDENADGRTNFSIFPIKIHFFTLITIDLFSKERI